MKDVIKTYTIEHEYKEGMFYVRRKNDGFDPFELLGILEELQLDILKQIKGEIKPTVIKREVVEPLEEIQ